MNEEINLEEIFTRIEREQAFLTKNSPVNTGVLAMKEACLATIELCCQKACVTNTGRPYTMSDYQSKIIADDKVYCVAKRSIKDVELLIK